MPLNIDFVQILLHMLNFVILAGGLSLILYKPICKFLKQREDYYADLEETNKKNAEENEKLRVEYETKLAQIEKEAEKIRSETEKEAAEAVRTYLSEAKAKADTIIATAEQDAELRKEHILESAQAEIEGLVITSTEKLIGETATPERDSKMYDEFLRTLHDSDTEPKVN